MLQIIEEKPENHINMILRYVKLASKKSDFRVAVYKTYFAESPIVGYYCWLLALNFYVRGFYCVLFYVILYDYNNTVN